MYRERKLKGMCTCVKYLYLLQAKADERRIINKVLGIGWGSVLSTVTINILRI